MKIGIISDIHGNLPALKVILERFEEEQCDFIYCLGDMIAIGPFSKECAELLLSLPNIRFVMGNHEEYFLYGLSNEANEDMSEGERKHQIFIASTLSQELKGRISTFPYLITENIEGVRTAFVHYALDNKGSRKTFKPIEKNITEDGMDELFQDIDADLIFFGHEHKGCNIKGRKHYVDVGSSGCTTEDFTHCTIVDFIDGSYEVSQHRIKYDKSEVFRAMEERQIPEREFIAKIFFGRK